MARKKNTWVWVAGGALLLWWLSRRNRPAGGGAAPGGGGNAPAVLDALNNADNVASKMSFEVDTTTDRELYADSQKQCK
jgi:hypothetical protein